MSGKAMLKASGKRYLGTTGKRRLRGATTCACACDDCFTAGSFQYSVNGVVAWPSRPSGGGCKWEQFDMFGQEDACAVIWAGHTTNSGVCGQLVHSGGGCTSSSGSPCSFGDTSEVGQGFYFPVSGSSKTFRFWYSQWSGCVFTQGVQTPTSAEVTVTNTGSNTIAVNGVNLAPGFARTFSIPSLGYLATRDQSAYAGGVSLTIVAACA